jgi:signal transduction histidine kinase
LIDDLLTLERVESERQSSWKNVDFTELVKDTVAAQQSAAELKQQILTLRILPSDDADYNVFGSATQLRQAVANLVNNASKYTPDGGTIAVTLAPQESRLIFEVKDNGYGISKERQERLFQRFYRAKEVATEHIPGTGLGLSLVKTVVDRHGGEVWVRSELGQGSTFAFSLPISEVREETPAGMSEGHSLDK